MKSLPSRRGKGSRLWICATGIRRCTHTAKRLGAHHADRRLAGDGRSGAALILTDRYAGGALILADQSADCCGEEQQSGDERGGSRRSSRTSIRLAWRSR